MTNDTTCQNGLEPRYLFILWNAVLILCCLIVATTADADPNRATPATYEQIDLPLSATREQDLQLQLKKKSPTQNITLSQIKRIEEDPIAIEPYSPLQTLGSLFFVLTLFGCVAYWLRRGSRGSNPLLSEDAWEILGRGNLGAKHDVQLVRLGSRILLIGHSPNTIQTLVEITDPREVQSMLQRCRPEQPHARVSLSRKIFAALSGKTDDPIARIESGTHPAYVEPRDA
ncbi:MAG: flagellar biosynthetic protein FliO [Planctomycetota bacterium]|nr:flagellar biosynthetic protein FliO [Planctomycetota bacterium]